MRRTRQRTVTVALVCGAVATAQLAVVPVATAVDDGDGGQLVLVGGSLADDNEQIYGEIVRRAGGAGAHIGIVTAAAVPESQDPDAGTANANNSVYNGEFYGDLLEEHGAGRTTWIPLDLDHPEAALDPQVVDEVEDMTGFFFGGGDQYRYVTLMTDGADQRDTPLLAAIRDRFEDGAVVAGTSAGMQVMASENMVTGGESWEGLVDGSSPGYSDDATELKHLPAGGFGFFTSGLLDTHFGAWGRQGRAVRLASDTGEDRVFGVDPNTALVVDRAGTRRERLRVIGTNAVNVLDLRAARTTEVRGHWGIMNVRWTSLSDGDRYDPARWATTPAPGSTTWRPDAWGIQAQRTDIFSSLAGDGTEFVLSDLAHDLASSRDRATIGTTYESGPTYRALLVEGADFRARSHDGATATSFENLRLNLLPGS
ncbi:cyanophycinase [Isoptericola jiangsuensis]|uniref:Cyanophycinase n=1 Tax=Isoptericola jiangsuensis TaxID=548579 RepID=A0A2A9EWH0_9MICO|nr:cyanophycinase [Isoptericola jiangsuensis]PFG43364.1 cyanophycinase [Isoptericola jiangsuensis]